MTSLLSTLLAAALALAQSTPATPKPDLSGTWIMDRSQSESTNQGEPLEPVKLDIKQTATEFTVETTRGEKSSARTYQIDMSPKPGAGGVGAGASRAYWDGTKLVTEAAGNVQGQTVSIRETRSLNAAGTEMTVESLVIVQHGYSFRGARNYGAAKDVFTRSRQP